MDTNELKQKVEDLENRIEKLEESERSKRLQENCLHGSWEPDGGRNPNTGMPRYAICTRCGKRKRY